MATRSIPMSRTLLRLAFAGDDPYASFKTHLQKQMTHPRMFRYQKAAYDMFKREKP